VFNSCLALCHTVSAVHIAWRRASRPGLCGALVLLSPAQMRLHESRLADAYSGCSPLLERPWPETRHLILEAIPSNILGSVIAGALLTCTVYRLPVMLYQARGFTTQGPLAVHGRGLEQSGGTGPTPAQHTVQTLGRAPVRT